MILNVSAVLMTYSFMLADQIILERIQSTTQNQLKWIFYEHGQICIFRNGMRRLTFHQTENNIYNLKKNIWSMSQSLIIPKLSKLGLATIGSQLRLTIGWYTTIHC